MKVRVFGRTALSAVVAAALLAACGGSQPPIGAPGAMPQARAVATQADRGGSWMLPTAKSDKLVYIAAGAVYVYAYDTNQLVGTLARIGETGYECSDKDGDVFVPVDQSSSNTGVYEYAHGGTSPINYFSVPGAWACAVDPLTGNLAVVNSGPTVYIFPNASGSPEMYTDSKLYLSQDVAYDDSGNLFIDGSYSGSRGITFAMVELPVGTSNFEEITVGGSQNDNNFNPLAWDGQYLGLGSYRSTKRVRSQEVVQRLAVSGSSATIVGYVPLGSQREPYHLQFWTNGHVAIQASNKPRNHSLIQYFSYPQGKIIKSLVVQQLGAPYGITVSD